VDPILHLSLPVRDLQESVEFYVGTLGCTLGRVRADFVDIWFYGMQVSLHDEPDQVRSAAENGVRHFGVTLERAELDALIARLDREVVEWSSPLHTDHVGTPLEQTKAKILDPSGNVIEVKSYADVRAALG